MNYLTRQEINELEQICDWLDRQPCKSAYSKAVIDEIPHLSHWFSFAWRHKRKSIGLFYYQVNYGWRLHRRSWKRRLDLLVQSVS